MQFVLDNSVAMRWLFADGSASDERYANWILEQLTNPGCQAIAPSIWPLEVANVISRAERQDLLQEARSTQFLNILADLNVAIDTQTVERALQSTLDIARRYRLSAYDAAYLELALNKSTPLATLDGDLRKAAQKAGAALMGQDKL